LRPILKGVTHFVGFVPAVQANPQDGTFRFPQLLTGEYRASAGATGHYVKELRFENSDALNSPLELSESGSTAPSFQVVLSPNVAQVDGVVTDDKNQPLPGVQAVLIPDRNRDRIDLYKSAMTDQAGRFNMRDVAPGEYKLFTWDFVDNFAYFEPGFIERYEQLGKAVRLDEGTKLNVDAKLIPERR
jgi:hypothetical protein